jgi:hypothetical protein
MYKQFFISTFALLLSASSFAQETINNFQDDLYAVNDTVKKQKRGNPSRSSHYFSTTKNNC